MNYYESNSSKIVIAPEEYLEFFIDKELPESKTILTISNNSENIAAYKIKSSSPKDFLISKSEDIIQPMNEVRITIIYKVSEESFYKFHKFLLQTAPVDDINNINWKANGVHEYKLCAKFHEKKILVLENPADNLIEIPIHNPNNKLIEHPIEISSYKNTGNIKKIEELNERKKANDRSIDNKRNIKAANQNTISFQDKIFEKKFNYIHIVLSFIIGVIFSYLILRSI